MEAPLKCKWLVVEIQTSYIHIISLDLYLNMSECLRVCLIFTSRTKLCLYHTYVEVRGKNYPAGSKFTGAERS